MKKCLFILLAGILMFSGLSNAQTNPKWITQVIMSPPNPTVGNAIQFSATFRIAKGPSTNLRVVGGVDGKPIYNQKFPSLPKSADQPVMFTWTATQGSHTAFFELQPDPSSGDDVPGDNYIQKVFNVGGGGPGPVPGGGGKANLVITDINVTPASLTEGASANFNFNIENIGGTTAAANSVVLKVNGVQSDSKAVKSLAPGGSVNCTFIWKAKCGAKVEIVVDPSNLVSESNENDNKWGIPSINCGDFKPVPGKVINLGPNLMIEKVNWNPAQFTTVGGTIKFTFSVKNTGLGVANPIPIVTFSTNGKPPMSLNIPAPPASGLKQGESLIYTAETVSNCIINKATVKIVIDPANQLQETEENDNTWTHEFQCLEKLLPVTVGPNLEITSYTASKSNAAGCVYNFKTGFPNICVFFGFTIKNTGNRDITINSTYSFNQVLKSPVTEAWMIIPPLKAGQEWKESVVGYIDCNFQIKLVIDLYDVIKETNENDNWIQEKKFSCD